METQANQAATPETYAGWAVVQIRDVAGPQGGSVGKFGNFLRVEMPVLGGVRSQYFDLKDVVSVTPCEFWYAERYAIQAPRREAFQPAKLSRIHKGLFAKTRQTHGIALAAWLLFAAGFCGCWSVVLGTRGQALGGVILLGFAISAALSALLLILSIRQSIRHHEAPSPDRALQPAADHQQSRPGKSQDRSGFSLPPLPARFQTASGARQSVKPVASSAPEDTLASGFTPEGRIRCAMDAAGPCRSGRC